jgi:hypothetical protein
MLQDVIRRKTRQRTMVELLGNREALGNNCSNIAVLLKKYSNFCLGWTPRKSHENRRSRS